ncbi:Bromodomain-containing protein [Neolentinus lepideus HHB14362 ss-1]|uniref:Bromodomain-containing protein n=1 Tax=Neolentinus lepideus HHB14362 ss-1 TaxID=1314782 RepID=A0A165W775_9AGAM|nr:Bromodomain-containing protein [Neolentinus lepideus HHB14362 ss-1]
MGNMKRELELMAANDVDADAPRAKRRKEAAAASPDDVADAKGVKVEDSQGGGGGREGQTSESVREQGMQLWQTVKDAVNKEGRILSLDFMRLPSKRQYPDYYQLIKRPIALDEIKAQLQRGGYQSLELVRADLEQLFVNAKKYNIRESQIWKDAKTLHKLVKKEYAKVTGTMEEEPADAGEKPQGMAEGSDIEGDKKSKTKVPNMNRLLKGRLQKLVEKTDDSGRVLSEEFMELPNKKQWAVYYKTIKRPQCLENIFKHLKRKEYHTPAEFARDVELVFSNALEFNQDHTPIWEDAFALRDYFRKLMSDLPAPYALPEYAPALKPVPAQPSARIKLKMSGASQAAPAPGPSTDKASSPLTLRVPNTPAGHSSPPAKIQNTDTAKVKSLALAPLSPATSTPPAIAPKAPATTVAQTQPVQHQAASSKAPAAAAPSYSSAHYPNAMYPQAAAGTTPAIAPASSIAPADPPSQQTQQKTASKSPAPSPKSQLKHVSLSTSPTTRRIDLDVEDGVKSWAMRLTTGERVVTIRDVSFVEEEEKPEETAEEQEQEEPAKDVKGKAKARGAARKKDASLEDPNSQVNGKAVKGLEALQVRLNGIVVKSMQSSEWQVDLPVGSSMLELGEQAGVPWKVYFDRPPL